MIEGLSPGKWQPLTVVPAASLYSNTYNLSTLDKSNQLLYNVLGIEENPRGGKPRVILASYSQLLHERILSARTVGQPTNEPCN